MDTDRRMALAVPFLLVLILLLGSLLYMRGVSFGLPFFYHWDEPALVQIGARVVQDGEFNPRWFHYPTLPGYLQAAAYAACFLFHTAGAEEYRTIQQFPLHLFYLWGRSLTVALALGAALATALLAARTTRRPVAALAAAPALLLALGFFEEARYITPNVPSALFAVLAVLALGNGLRRHQFALAGLLAGLAMGCKYNLVVLLVPLLVAALFTGEQKDRSGAAGRGAILLGTAAAGFLVSTPFLLTELPTFLNHFGFELHHYRAAGHVGAEGQGNTVFYLRHLLMTGLGIPLFAAALLGLLNAVVRDRKALLHPVFLFPPLYLIALSMMKVNFTRNLVPLYPFFAIWAARFVVEALSAVHRRWGRKAAIPAVLALVLLALLPASRIRALGSYLQRTDNRTLAREWVIDNVPPGSTVYVETQRTGPHPYGGLTRAPTIPEDRYDVITIKDLRLHHRPSEFLLREDVHIVCCLDRGYYAAHHQLKGERAFDQWQAGAKVLNELPWSAERPGGAITVLRPYAPERAQQLAEDAGGVLSLGDHSLQPFLLTGWEKTTSDVQGMASRWSDGLPATLALPPGGGPDASAELTVLVKGEGALELRVGDGPTMPLAPRARDEWVDVRIPWHRGAAPSTPVTVTIGSPDGGGQRIAVSRLTLHAP